MAASSQRLSSRLFEAAGSAIRPFSTDSANVSEDLSTFSASDLECGQKWALLTSNGSFVREEIVVTAVHDRKFLYRKMGDPDETGSMTAAELRELVATDRARFEETVELTA